MMQVLGGIMIGLAATIMLLFNGRVTGISSMIRGLLRPIKGDISWRFLFILGLLTGGVILKLFYPSALTLISQAKNVDYVFAGFLVGLGTFMANGCTSGHAVCGISRFSHRSIMATLTFIISGIVSVLIFKMIRGEL